MERGARRARGLGPLGAPGPRRAPPRPRPSPSAALGRADRGRRAGVWSPEPSAPRPAHAGPSVGRGTPAWRRAQRGRFCGRGGRGDGAGGPRDGGAPPGATGALSCLEAPRDPGACRLWSALPLAPRALKLALWGERGIRRSPKGRRARGRLPSRTRGGRGFGRMARAPAARCPGRWLRPGPPPSPQTQAGRAFASQLGLSDEVVRDGASNSEPQLGWAPETPSPFFCP